MNRNAKVWRINMRRDFIVWCAGEWSSFHRRLPILSLRQNLNPEDRVLVVNRPLDPSRLLKGSFKYKPLYTTENNIEIFTPRLPLHDHLSFRHETLAQLNFNCLKAQLKPWLRSEHKVAHWLMHPVFYPFLHAAPCDYLLYDCYDEYTETPGQPPHPLIKQYEDIVLRRANYTMVASDIVLRRKINRARYIRRVPNPTDLDLFARARTTELAIPQEVQSIAAPRAIYIGGIKTVLDQDLLFQLARHFPKVSWLFVGRDEQGKVDRLKALPNVHFLGARQIHEIPAYLKSAHFGLIPYLIDEYTSMVQPNKAVEYLAAGLGVLSSEIPGLKELFPETLSFYATTAEAITAVETLLQHPRYNLPLESLQHYDWNYYIQEILDSLEKAI
jgi:glycosyltransferase involved in cell wall biosynthesis